MVQKYEALMLERNRYREQAVKFQEKYKSAKKDSDCKSDEITLLNRENTALKKEIKKLKEIVNEKDNCISY